MPINSITKLFAEEDPQNVMRLLLEQQEKTLKEEIQDRQVKLQTLGV